MGLSAGYASGCLLRSATPNTSPTSCPPPEPFLQTPSRRFCRRTNTHIRTRGLPKKQPLINSLMSRCHINRNTTFVLHGSVMQLLFCLMRVFSQTAVALERIDSLMPICQPTDAGTQLIQGQLKKPSMSTVVW